MDLESDNVGINSDRHFYDRSISKMKDIVRDQDLKIAKKLFGAR